MALETQDNFVTASGHLDVGDGHKIYWEDWGNPDAAPIMHFHGGPGGGFNENHKIIYDPLIHRVIFHDQRGSGQSLPLGELENNTAQHLVDDIEQLRQHRDIEKSYVTGGSWGACLALQYAIAHPDRAKELMIWSTFLGRKVDAHRMYDGHPSRYIPESWERFIQHVPAEEQQDPDAVMQFYFDKISSDDQDEAQYWADEWALWDTSLVAASTDWETHKKEVPGALVNLIMGKIHLNYCLNDSFLPENHIINNIDRIRDIPCHAVQGRFDFCTPAVAAYELSEAYGHNLDLQVVSSGHLRTDPIMRQALSTIALEKLV